MPTPDEVIDALRVVARYFDGERGPWAYDVFDAINATYFESRLPTPKIQWSLTAHGRCLGLTHATARPVITLHPSLLGGTEKPNPWGIERQWLGVAYAFDILLHESIHVSQFCLHGGGHGPTSHNNTAWVAEVNRIAPLLGFDGVEAGLSKTKRVRIEGETRSRVVRVSEGNLPHCVVAGFPNSVRNLLGTADSFYRANVPPVTGNNVLQIPRRLRASGS
jgi:hypothetical protein